MLRNGRSDTVRPPLISSGTSPSFFNIIHPNKVDPEDFFRTDSQPAGREAEQTKNLEKEKSKGASGKPKEKPKIFYLESKKGRKYIVDSGASFHLVSSDSLSKNEAKTIVPFGETIPIQTTNGEVELTEKVKN